MTEAIPEEEPLITFEDITYPTLPPVITNPEQSLSFGFEPSLVPSAPPLSASLTPSAPLCIDSEVEGFTVVNSPSTQIFSLTSNDSSSSNTEEGTFIILLNGFITYTSRRASV